MELVRNVNILSTLPIPSLEAKQINRYTSASLQTRFRFKINPLETPYILKNNNKTYCLVIDIGGTALKYLVASKNPDGKVIINDEDQISLNKQKDGLNYLDILQEIATQYKGMPVAISVAGIVTDNVLTDSPNLPAFVRALSQIGGFDGIFGCPVPVMNDAEAGAIAGAVGVAALYNRDKSIIYLINGGGIGGAKMNSNGSIYAMEPGHIEVINKLNPQNVLTPCGMQNKTFVCVERVGASGAGIEAQWFRLKGKKIEGKQIAEKMYNGDPIALALYANSSLIIAHIIEGIRHAGNLSVDEVSIVLHGGFFNTIGVVERIQKTLNKHYGKNVDILSTSKLGYNNACMTGLAIAAFTMF